jgi:acyl-CoA reductase-like NAD-dependent aldehyde dehydrogenase
LRTEPRVERLRSAAPGRADVAHAATAELGELGAFVGGRTALSGDAVEVRSPFDGRLVAVVHRAGPDEIEEAIARSVRAFEETRRLPSWRRAQILDGISAALLGRRDELARTIALEAAKPIKVARIEVERAAFTFKVAAEETKRIYGEIVPLDWVPGTEGRIAQVHRVPLGPVAGITPFNFPLNLVVHKVAPALAAGNPILVRPASQTPVSALKLGEIVVEAGWPADGIAVVPSATDVAAPLVEDDRIKLLTFTGSPSVGWALKGRAGRKRVIAAVDRSELGLQAGIFTRDWPTIRRAFDRIETGGLVVNDVPTFRIDHMPYGGVKQSGFGREGIRYAIEEMTELRLLALNDRG